MSATLLAYAPLVCRLGMAATMGTPALVGRVKRRGLGVGPSPPTEGARDGELVEVGGRAS